MRKPLPTGPDGKVRLIGYPRDAVARHFSYGGLIAGVDPAPLFSRSLRR
jgi:hypothetical protein